MVDQVLPQKFRSIALERDTNVAAGPLLNEAATETMAGNHHKAAAAYLRILQSDARHPEALTGLANALRRQGNHTGATQAFETAISRHPGLATNYFGYAELLRRTAGQEAALATCNKGLALAPGSGEGLLIRAMIFKDLGQADDAIADLRAIVAVAPAAVPVHMVLISTLERFGRASEAIDALKNAAHAAPDNISILRNLYMALHKQDRAAEALEAWEKIAALVTDDPEVHRSLGLLYQEQGKSREAFDAFHKAIEIDPKFVRGYLSLANFVAVDNQFHVASSIFKYLTMLCPGDVHMFHSLGRSLRIENKWDEANVVLAKALEIDPSFLNVYVELCIINKYSCDWSAHRKNFATMRSLSASTGAAHPPLILLSVPGISRDDHLAAARAWAKLEKASANKIAPYPMRRIEGLPRRLKIGYVSSDLHTHATSMLVVELLEKHDRSKFEVYAYSFGPDDGSPMRRRVVKAFDVFREFKGVSSAEATRQIHDDGIDILIDLKGYTQDCRTEVFVARPAPIQVNFLGYPGSMGAPFIDYIIADPVVVPLAHAASYDEKIVHLPHCYQPNDRQRAISSYPFSRRDSELPEDAFVFCSFNNPYKLTEQMFSVWMYLLRETPGSVLWLFTTTPEVVENLRREAELRGVAASRIVFTRRLSAEHHLGRMKLADLFLDTAPYNAHTTASDALWTGLPVLTYLGETFAGRVAASLLQAAGLPGLVASSIEDYAAKALYFTRHRAELSAIRHQLETTRHLTPLFDTDLYARHFDAALLRMAELSQAGEEPQSFAVPAQC